PAPNDWRGISFYNTTDDATSILDHCIVEYGNYYYNYGNIYTLQSSPTIANTVVRKSGKYGIRIGGGAPVIQNSNIVENTDFGIYFDTGSAATITGNTISSANSISIIANDVGAATISDNTFDAGGYITVRAGTISNDATWSAINVPYRPNGNITVLGIDGTDGITTLTLEPGVIIETYLNAIIVGAASGNPGALVARGTEAAPIIFTSSQDTPLPNDWRGLWFYNTTDDTTSILDHCIVEYGSYYNNYGNIYALQSSPTITNTVVRKSGNAGIRVNAGAPIIQNSTIVANTTDGVYIDSGTPVINNNDIYSNTGYGINNRTTTTINAENNWWGHASGPLDNSDDTATGGLYNLAGTGSQVTNYVDYDPWTTDGPNIDTDNDGLSDYDEMYEYGTDPNNPDTDGDGLSDFDEIFTHGTDPKNPDSDGDGISDYDEVITYNTDPNNTDLDGDGLSDYDEINIYGTDPNNADTDGDGIRDDIEITLGTDPNNKLDKPALYNITLTTDTTFSNDVGPYVIQGALTVSEGVTLHIEPGTLLKFDTAATLVVDGTLDAPGIEGNEIIFTSLDNDAYGGDTNEDGSATTPAPGDWGGIWLNNTSGTSILDHCTIEYGGYNGSGIVNIAQASPQLFNSTVHLSSNDGIYINGGSAEIQYSTIVNNETHGFYIDSGTPVINNNDIYANSGNGIYNTSVTMINAENNWWGDASGPYHVTSNSSATGDQISDNVDYEPWITDGPNIDADGDGLTNYDELYLHETNPNNSDSDSDGLTDYEEVITYNTDPNSLDSDNDGFTDYEEIITYGTDPNVPN
ncbi:right-handed parallel beta-helix repeat-containing protein, partial [Myxococcota bacterium]|nr:right-handed parallel beta-helix repeat-containing protein [Myxococcota bacterium]